MKRRDVLAAAPFAGLAAVTAGAVPVKAMEQGGFETFGTPRDRLAFIAETLDIPMPAGLPSGLEDRDGAPCVEVLAFCEETGASLDYIYLGDIRAMFRGIYYRHRAAKPETPVMVLFREWQKVNAEEKRLHAELPNDEEGDAAVEAMSELEGEITHEIIAMPVQSPMDFVMKIAAWTDFGVVGTPDVEHSPELWAEARTLIGGVA